MCGIAGVLGPVPLGPGVLARMGDAIAHRGPDGEGTYTSLGMPNVELVSRRLAIVDVAHGSQPMTTPDGRYTIVYNGELYNAEEVRRALAGAGHTLRTRCDTEIVLHAFAVWQEKALDRLNGMFAFAVWDDHRRSLFLARDRLGIKPLLYAADRQGLVFGSELRAVFASGLIAPSLDLDALPYYLTSFVVPDPLTFFKGVRRLPAGCYLTAGADGHRVTRYWDCAFGEEDDRGHDAYVEEFTALLSDAVERQLVSDVPVGVFLSSGVDSGLVGAYAASHSGALHSFTLGFEGGGADERAGARRLAGVIGTKHAEDVVDAAQALDALPGLLGAHGEPSQSLLQNHFVSAFARQEVKVALAGVGGDELFGSYPSHVVVNALARFDALPASLRRAAVSLSRAAPDERVRRLAALAAADPRDRVAGRLLHQVDPGERVGVLTADAAAAIDLDAPTRTFAEHWDRAAAEHPLNRLLYVYVKTYLADELLRTLDTMSMHNSLEARVPLLDHRLVERALQVPARHKVRGSKGKRLLHDIHQVVVGQPPNRRKQGFSLPLEAWMRGPFAGLIDEVVRSPALRDRGVFDGDAAVRLVERWRGGEPRLGPLVMTLFTFELWAQQALDRPAPSGAPLALTPPRSPGVDVTVIVVSFNTRDLLRRALESVDANLAGSSFETIVVDNASSDGSPDMVEDEFPHVRLVRNDENVGFGRANNQAMRMAAGDWFMLLNSDALLTDRSVLDVLERARSFPDVGVAHCRLESGDGTLQHSTYRFPTLWTSLLEDAFVTRILPARRRGEVLLGGYWDQSHERDVEWVSGAFMLVRSQVLRDTGGFSDDIFMYGEEMEWCRRIQRAGWRVRYFPGATVVHLEHKSTELVWTDEERVALCIDRAQELYERDAGRVRGRLFALGEGGRRRRPRRLLHGAGVAPGRRRVRTAPALRPYDVADAGPAGAAAPATVSYFGDPRPDIQQIVGERAGRVLDVGCGEGALGAALKQAGATCVVGVEQDASAAAVARERLDSVVVGDADAVDVPTGPFDWMVFADVLEHLPDPDAVLGRYIRALAPGGSVVVSLPNYRFWSVLGRLLVDRWSYTDAGVRDRTHLRVFTRRSALRMIEDSGLSVTRPRAEVPAVRGPVLDRPHRRARHPGRGQGGAVAARAGAVLLPVRRGRHQVTLALLVGPTARGTGEAVYVSTVSSNPPPGWDYRLAGDFHAGADDARCGVVSEVLLNRVVRPLAVPDMGIRSLSVGDKYDLVHVHAHPARLRTGAPVVMSEGSSSAVYLADYLGWPEERVARRYSRARKLYRALGIRDRLLAMESVTRVYVFSEWARQLNIRWGADPAKLTVVPPGFPSQKRERERESSFSISEPFSFSFLFVGTDFGRKGGFDVVEAFTAVLAEAPHARLRMVTVDPGAPSPDPLVREWVEPARRGRGLAALDALVARGVAVVGPLVGRESGLADAYAAADAFVMPTLAEGFGFTNVEAMSYGLPVVSTSVGPIPEIVTDGLLVAPGDVDALAEAMLRLANDPALAPRSAMPGGRRSRPASHSTRCGRASARCIATRWTRGDPGRKSAAGSARGGRRSQGRRRDH